MDDGEIVTLAYRQSQCTLGHTEQPIVRVTISQYEFHCMQTKTTSRALTRRVDETVLFYECISGSLVLCIRKRDCARSELKTQNYILQS
jgi:hypothetical protein